MIKWEKYSTSHLFGICSEYLEFVVSQIGVVNGDDHGSSACLGEYYQARVVNVLIIHITASGLQLKI